MQPDSSILFSPDSSMFCNIWHNYIKHFLCFRVHKQVGKVWAEIRKAKIATTILGIGLIGLFNDRL
jgi:hypothetical protein